MFTPLSPERQQRLRDIKLLILDVDGVLTSAQLFIGGNGEIIKAFNTLDGHGIKMLHQTGVQTAIITARSDPAVAHRAAQLGINHYFKGIHDKRAAYAELRGLAGVAEDECAFIGDDVVDLPVMVRCGLPVAVPEAHWFVKQYAAHITLNHAGGGAVRELCDLIMQAQGTLAPALEEYVK
ncbi:MAG: KdsC family phosphatase [Neisseria elongata]